MHITEAHIGSMPKVERYGWRITDKPGTYMMIDKRELQIDDRYQRDVTAKDPKIARITAEWSWLACGIILVGMRDGVAYVMDGQHRVVAARRRADILELPCLVFETDGPTKEAQGFLAANVNRKPMTMVQRFKALIVTGDPIAVAADAMIKGAGRKASKVSDTNTITCVAELMRVLRLNKDETSRVWPVITDLCKGRRLHGAMLSAAVYAEANAADGASLADAPWRQRLLAAGYDQVVNAMAAARAYHGKGTPKVEAEGLLKAMNFKARVRLFALKTDG